MIKTPEAIKMPYFLEAVSAKNPEISVPNQAPSSRIEVSQPLRVWSAGLLES